jgi:AMMECR1 domain-containing protein
MEMQQTHCHATVLLRYYGNATGCIGHVTKENPICHNIFNFDLNLCLKEERFIQIYLVILKTLIFCNEKEKSGL